MPGGLPTLARWDLLFFVSQQPYLPCLLFGSCMAESHLYSQANAQNMAEHMPYAEPPPGFAQAVGKPHRTDQHSHSPDEVLASNFGRKLNMDNGNQGQFSRHPFCSSTTLPQRMQSHSFLPFHRLSCISIRATLFLLSCSSWMVTGVTHSLQQHTLCNDIARRDSNQKCVSVKTCLLQVAGCRRRSLLSGWTHQGIPLPLAGLL